MSGGHYDYGYQRLNRLAEDLECDALNPEEWCVKEMTDERSAILMNTATLLRIVSDLCHDIEWAMSGDYDFEDIEKAWGKAVNPIAELVSFVPEICKKRKIRKKKTPTLVDKCKRLVK